MCIKVAEIGIVIDPDGICEDRHDLIINKTMTPAGKMLQNPLTLQQTTPDLSKLPVVTGIDISFVHIDLTRLAKSVQWILHSWG